MLKCCFRNEKGEILCKINRYNNFGLNNINLVVLIMDLNKIEV